MDKKELLDESLKTQVDSLLETIADDSETEKSDRNEEEEIVKLLDDKRLLVGTQEYELSIDHREGFDAEALAGRYTSILSKYDYIVGDWGYEQLRLKGFYRNNNSKVSQDKKISFLEDYLYEYCNFGCAYFVIEKTRAEKEKITKTKRNRKRKNREANREELPADATVQTAAQPTPIPAPAQPNKNKVTKNVERPKSQGKKKGFVIKDVNEKDSQPKDQPKTTTTRSAKGEKKSFQIKKIEQ
ncbi:YutD family protein [Trichococcus sp. K1Tr]|uniref:YutD family protein n=1 Tax=Trichococcus sp. K1Tr TaxID=3020847 RepID=UPI002330A270|nr:YutD family protein [Trichococcus sp. K1Tr]MDB6354606.1 YutD family protein [Trichococcus sp. K1Tr]